jgi:hypothetical protein
MPEAARAKYLASCTTLHTDPNMMGRLLEERDVMPVSTNVTDEQIQQLAQSAKSYSVAQLRWGPERYRDGAEAIELEHQRRMVSMRADGVIAILCPIISDSLAGLAIMTVPPEKAREIMADDPCVQAGMMTCDVFSGLSFPGDNLPG